MSLCFRVFTRQLYVVMFWITDALSSHAQVQYPWPETRCVVKGTVASVSRYQKLYIKHLVQLLVGKRSLNYMQVTDHFHAGLLKPILQEASKLSAARGPCQFVDLRGLDTVVGFNDFMSSRHFPSSDV